MVPYAIIFDLEDSIRDEYKESARELLRSVFTEYSDTCGDLFRCWVRINDRSSEFFSDDLKWLHSFDTRHFGVKIPKCSGREDIIALEHLHSDSTPIIPTIEALKGYENRDIIMESAQQTGIKNIGFGAGDMTLELDIERDYTLPILQHIICELVIASKRHGLDLIDSTSRVLPKSGSGWQALIEEEVAFSCANGFSGKKAIHPEQVPVIERVFSSRHERDVVRAREVMDDIDSQSKTRAIRSSKTGNYVGNPSIKHATRVLETSDDSDDETS
ncbi:HpcH/HpaI aldolase/citrate lyase family protein [Solemya elarraichensis gill symbiont]|uniref:HpcH/HpaI aldolase/citrate lyase domain-containing protein n=1 Tax=Solemya elarraichensis gill symbiont TaxID=1918949 RepID=A0A1T2LCM3_9GAMM|nr:aldolase/citrate lyase family protein [Solemya elarraichensis gill symbiont]OOZ42794.1 hypothetical protein BOW52_01565 [Solemya elarraichensis gill symbiont]